MLSPLKSEQVVVARPSANGPGKPPGSAASPGGWLRWSCMVAALVALSGPGHAVASPPPTPSSQHALNASSWQDMLREFLREALKRNGGDPNSWPESTIDDAPMNFVQAVYVQMGGDPTRLDMSKTPDSEQDGVLHDIFVAVGGLDAGDTLVDDQIESRIRSLWEYFVGRGGELVKP